MMKVQCAVHLQRGDLSSYIKEDRETAGVVKYMIRKLIYKVEYVFQATPFSSTHPPFHYHDNMLSLILPNFLQTILFLNCVIITASRIVNWNKIDSSLTLAFLHLMHLPTININRIDLSSIENFPISSLSTSVHLRRLDIFNMSVRAKIFKQKKCLIHIGVKFS